jgi:MFS family permease
MSSAFSVAERVQRRLMVTLFSSQSVYSAAQIVSFTPLPLAAVYLTGSEVYAGIPATITLVGRAIIAYPIGWFMGRYGRRVGISFGFALSVIGALLCVSALVVGSFSLFCLGALVNGFGRGTGEQSRYAAADIVVPARASRAIGTIVFAGTIGAVLGPLLITPATRFAESSGLPVLAGPYVIAAALSFVAFALIFIFLRPDPSTLSQAREAANPDPVESATRAMRQIFADPTVQLAVLALTISQLVMTLIMVITPLHMAHESYTTQQIAWVIMAHTLGMFGLSGVVGMLTTRYGRLPMIFLAGVILAISAILTPFAQSVPILALALFLLGLGWNFGFVAGSALLAESVTGAERTQVQGITETLVAAAAATGSFATGPTFQWGGIVAISMLGLAMSLALVTGLFMHRRVPHPATAGD